MFDRLVFEDLGHLDVSQVTDVDAARRESFQARKATVQPRAARPYVRQQDKAMPAEGDWVYALLRGVNWTQTKARTPETRRDWRGPYLVGSADGHKAWVVGRGGDSVKFPPLEPRP